MNKYLILTVLLINCTFIFGQEYVTQSGFSIDKSEFIENERNSKNIDTLELPFIDDFSKSFPYVNPDLWLNDNVLITQSACVNPPSIGAVVFDAVKSNGEFYTSKYSTSHKADTLTSYPINLDYPENNTIYFSFFFQPQGIADSPELKDSLILQFYAPETQAWKTEWYAQGSNLQEFQQIILSVNDEKYLKKGFAFRFVNWASLSGDITPSKVTNCDHWLVDYIRLDKNRTADDLMIPELAMQYPPKFLIDDYEMFPYEHYKEFPAKFLFNHSYTVKLKNNENSIRTIDSLYLVFKEKNNRVENDTLFLGSYNVPSNQNIKLSGDEVDFAFPNTSNYILDYEMEGVLVTNSEDSVFNNRVKFNKPISGYYAYDDGSAEAGYGLNGQGTIQSMVAVKFVSYKEDTISGIRIYFNNTFKDEQPDYFNLMVWDYDETTQMPGEVIYEKSAVSINKSHLNEFFNYEFDSIFSVADTFFVGWQNTSDKFINMGIDYNSTTNHKYFNIYGEWQASEITGDLLLRPIFGNSTLLTIPEDEISEIQYNIYPNPANDVINIENLSKIESENIFVCIYDIYGRIVYNMTFDENSEISVSGFAEGFYIVRIFEENKPVYTSKVIIKH